MAVTVTSTGAVITNSDRVVVRSSSGIPYVIVNDSGDIDVYKGNGTTPTSFSSNGTGPSNARYGHASAAIDSSNIIHIAYYDSNGKSSALRYVTYNTSTDSFSGDVSAQDIGAATPSNPATAIAIDSNDIPHIAWVDSNSNMGTNYDTIYYTNKVGGSWNTQVEVDGQANETQTRYPDIAIDSDNLPVISYTKHSTAFSGKAALGNANNATSFSLFEIESGSSIYIYTTSIAVDSSGNHHVAFLKVKQPATTGDSLYIRKHNYGDTWTTTWQTIETVDSGLSSGTSLSYNLSSLVIDKTDRYIFVEDKDNDDIVYYYDTGSGWTSGGTLETGTYQDVKAKWAFWVDNDSGGSLSILSSAYYFDGSDAAATDPDNAWTNETNIDDGSSATDATTTTSFFGTSTTNYIQVEGTNAPSTGDNIIGVVARINHQGSELVKYSLLNTPSGGWSWTKIQALETRVYFVDAGTNGIETADIYIDGDAGGTSLGTLTGFTSAIAAVSGIQLKVYTRKSSSELDYAFSDGTDIYFNSLSLGGEPPATTFIEWPTFMQNGFMNPRIGIG